MASSKKIQTEGQVLQEGILLKILQNIVQGRTDKITKLFAENPRLARATKDLDKATKSLAKELKKSGIKSFDKRKLIRKPY
jgi:hypothetical protein